MISAANSKNGFISYNLVHETLKKNNSNNEIFIFLFYSVFKTLVMV